jgi:hypothetical protein
MATWSRPRSIATIDLAPRDLRANLRRRQIRQERYTKEMSAEAALHHAPRRWNR